VLLVWVIFIILYQLSKNLLLSFRNSGSDFIRFTSLGLLGSVVAAALSGIFCLHGQIPQQPSLFYSF